MTYHYAINEAALNALKALDRHDRSRIPRVSLLPSMPAPRGVIYMPQPETVELPRTEWFVIGETRGSA